MLNNAKRNIPRFQLVKCASCSSRHVRTRSEPKCSLIPARYVSRKTHFGELLEMLSELMIECVFVCLWVSGPLPLTLVLAVGRDWGVLAT